MNPQITIPAAITAALFLPAITYRAAKQYEQAYISTSTYIEEVKERWLNSAGLESIKTEADTPTIITEAATFYRLNPKLLTALIHHESGGNSDAYSPKGAIGLTQIMPFNAKRCGQSKISKLWDETINIHCGAQILSEELKATNGNLTNALIRYNGGPKAVTGKYPESYTYADRVIKTFAQLSLS